MLCGAFGRGDPGPSGVEQGIGFSAAPGSGPVVPGTCRMASWRPRHVPATPAAPLRRRGDAHCYLKTVEGASTGLALQQSARSTRQAGYSACNIQKAYKLTKLSASTGSARPLRSSTPTTTRTPNRTWRSTGRQTTYRPARLTNGCFEKVNQEGVTGDPPAGDMSWGGEISLDLDMVSAMCPNCHIILVEANSNCDSETCSRLWRKP